MEDNCVNLATQISKVLVVVGFENSSNKVAMLNISDCESCTAEEIFEKVVGIENQLREKQSPSKIRDVVYCYWIATPVMVKNIDSKFEDGNTSATNSKSIIYVRGDIMTIREAIDMTSTDEEKNILMDFISCNLKLDTKNLSDEELESKIVMIPGEFKKKTFFKKFNENDLFKKIPNERLIGIS